MDTTLSNILADNALDLPARLLYATLHACTNGSGSSAMALDDLMTRMGVSSAAYLRRLRQQLQDAGYVDTYLDNGILRWTLLTVGRAPLIRTGALVERASAPVERAAADEERACEARSALVERASAPVERASAPVERAAADGERACEARSAPVERASAPVERAAADGERACEARSALVERASAPVERANAPVERANAPVERANAPVERAPLTTTGININKGLIKPVVVVKAEYPEQMAAFANRIHLIASPLQAEEMHDRLDALAQAGALAWWEQAIKAAEDNNALRWAYVRAVLDRCLREGRPPGAPKKGAKPDDSKSGRGDPRRAAIPPANNADNEAALRRILRLGPNDPLPTEV